MNYNRTPQIRIYRHCIKVGCKKTFESRLYKTKDTDYLCPFHREEELQRETDKIIKDLAEKRLMEELDNL